MRLQIQQDLDFSDVLLKPKRSTLASRSEVDVGREFITQCSSAQLSGVPIMAANMDTVGTMEAARTLSKLGLYTVLHKHYTEDELVSFYSENVPNTFYSMGTSLAERVKYDEVVRRLGYSPYVCIDVANGYSETFIDYCHEFRESNPSVVLMAGNVCTPEITEELILKGVDIVKIGIGGGSQCTTRFVTGVGVPQLTAVMDCADAAHGLGGLVCSDGGITCPGDVVKAFGGGADFVMMGGELAGHDESGGEEVYDDGVLVGKQTYGMSSGTAMKKHHGGVNPYRSSEGRTSIVPYRGPIADTVSYYLGGLRSGMTYIGAKKVKEISKRATFVRVGKILNETYRDSTQTFR